MHLALWFQLKYLLMMIVTQYTGMHGYYIESWQMSYYEYLLCCMYSTLLLIHHYFPFIVRHATKSTCLFLLVNWKHCKRKRCCMMSCNICSEWVVLKNLYNQMWELSNMTRKAATPKITTFCTNKFVDGTVELQSYKQNMCQ